MYIDSHAHFDICIRQTSFTTEELLKGMKENNVTYAVQVATEAESFDWCYEFSKKYDNIFFTLGVHPDSEYGDDDINILNNKIIEVLDNGDAAKLLGVGEIGLDYHWMTNPKEVQREFFTSQIEIAQKHNLPVIVHSRDAFKDTYDILKEMNVTNGILHCFSEGKDEAKAYVDMGLHVSFTGSVTFKNAKNIQDAAKYLPMDRILFETDCPYLTPVPMRGKKNKPEYVVHTYEYVSNLKNVSIDELKEAVFENFKSLAGL